MSNVDGAAIRPGRARIALGTLGIHNDRNFFFFSVLLTKSKKRAQMSQLSYVR